MFVFDSTLLYIALRTLIVYAIILGGFRLLGKREIGQMTPPDLVLLILVANAVQNAMTGPDTSVSGGVVAALTLLVTNFGVTTLVQRSRKARRLIEGVPAVLIRDGKILTRSLQRERITIEELEQALREHGVLLTEDVSLALLEIDGAISVLKKDDLPETAKPHHRIRFRRRQH